jgi:hypothetical protein
MILTDTIGNYLIYAGIALFIVFGFYKGKYRFIFLLCGIGLIGLRFNMNEIVVLKSNQKREKLLTFGSSFDYTFQDGSTSNISLSSNTLVNDTDDKLIIEEVEYSTYSSLNTGDNIVKQIESFSYTQLGNSVDYYFEEPPKTIRVKGGGSTTRYWLHK